MWDVLIDFFTSLFDSIILFLPAPKVKHKKKWVQNIITFFWYLGIGIVFAILAFLASCLIVFVVKWIINLIVQWYSDWYISSISK